MIQESPSNLLLLPPSPSEITMMVGWASLLAESGPPAAEVTTLEGVVHSESPPAS